MTGVTYWVRITWKRQRAILWEHGSIHWASWAAGVISDMMDGFLHTHLPLYETCRCSFNITLAVELISFRRLLKKASVSRGNYRWCIFARNSRGVVLMLKLDSCMTFVSSFYVTWNMKRVYHSHLMSSQPDVVSNLKSIDCLILCDWLDGLKRSMGPFYCKLSCQTTFSYASTLPPPCCLDRCAL